MHAIQWWSENKTRSASSKFDWSAIFFFFFFLHRGWNISIFSFTSPNKQDFRRSRVCLSGNRTPNVAAAESLSGDPFIALRCLVLQSSRVAKYYRTTINSSVTTERHSDRETGSAEEERGHPYRDSSIFFCSNRNILSWRPIRLPEEIRELLDLPSWIVPRMTRKYIIREENLSQNRTAQFWDWSKKILEINFLFLNLK